MKRLFMAISALAIFLSACSGNQQQKEAGQAEGTHQHDDGTVHQNHEEEKAGQEEFSVSADTLSTPKQNEGSHTHDGHEHPHNH